MFMSVNKDPGEAIECVEKVFDTEDDGLTAIEDNLFVSTQMYNRLFLEE